MEKEIKEALHKDVQILDTVHESLLQRDFLMQLRKVDQMILQQIASGTNFLSYVDHIIKSIWDLFPNHLRPCAVLCDKDLTQWRILNFSDWLELTDSVGQIRQIPKPMSTFVASPSRQFAHESNLNNRSEWLSWRDVFTHYNLNDCDMVSIKDHQGNWLTISLFSSVLTNDSEHRLHRWMINQMMMSIPGWFQAFIKRYEMDQRLKENTSEETGLLLQHAFDNDLDRMLRDARRYFQRLAFVSVLVNEEADADELKLLSDTLRSTLRENDLLANYSRHEFVMAMRIMQLDDAPVVAQKVLSALLKVDPQRVSALSGGVKIGMSLYPEQANHDKLYLASVAAANAVTDSVGYRLEYYGKFVKNLDEAYDL